MDRIEASKELVKMATDLAGDPMAGERLSSLFVKFHTWATKEATSKQPGSPVASQIIDGLTNVERKLKGKMNLTGRPAVEALIGAMKKDFTMYAAPIPALQRKYGQEIQTMFHGW